MTTQHTFLSVLILLIVFTMQACSDDSTSAGPDGDPPSLPTNIAPVVIDTQYFNTNSVPNDMEHSNYKSVEGMAIFGNTLFQADATVGLVNSFLSLAPMLNIQPEFDNGSWTWNFNVTGFFKDAGFFENEVVETIIQIIATPTSGGVEWVVQYTGNFLDTRVENFRFITGFTSTDGSNGEWRFFDPDGGNTPAAVYSWNIESDTIKTASIDINSYADFSNMVITYERDGAENWLSVEPANGQYSRVYWNAETHSGWYEDFQTERVCYTNFVNSGCS